MIALIIRILTAVLFIYLIYLILNWISNRSQNSSRIHEKADYDKKEWERIKKNLADEFTEDEDKEKEEE